MNDRVMDLLMDRFDSRDRRNNRRDRRDYERDRRDYEHDYEDERDYEDGRDYEDERRGVRGSGRNRRGDRRDSEDGGRKRSKLRLTRQDLQDWKRMMENQDGTIGAHYDMEEIMSVANKLGITFHEFNEGEFCTVVNMFYSDYCKTLKKFVGNDKLLECCVELAEDFLNDQDGPEPSDKVMLYYHCIVNG